MSYSRLLFGMLGFLVFTIGLLTSFFEFKAYLHLNNALGLSRMRALYGSDGPVESEIPGSTLRDREIDATLKAKNTVMGYNRAHVHLSSLFKELGDEVPNERIRFYCQALSELGAALIRDPLNSRYLINWANMKQVLGNTKCGQPWTSGDFDSAAALALNNDPTNVDIMYGGALIYIWAGRRSEALVLFNKVLTYGTTLSAGQRKFIFSEIKESQDVEAVIPARFPQVAEWSAAFNLEDRAAFQKHKGSFEKLQISALEENRKNYDQALIPSRIYYSRLLSLMDHTADSVVRQLLDKELARYYTKRGNKESAEYFAYRSELQDVKLIPAILPGDTRPLKAPLVDWGREERFYFDDFYKSIGFYLPHNQTPKTIELRGKNLGEALRLDHIKILVSDDNENWTEIPSDLQLRAYELGEKKIIAIRPGRGDFRYWKIHFASSLRNKGYLSDSKGMLRAFGYSRWEKE